MLTLTPCFHIQKSHRTRPSPSCRHFVESIAFAYTAITTYTAKEPHSWTRTAMLVMSRFHKPARGVASTFRYVVREHLGSLPCVILCMHAGLCYLPSVVYRPITVLLAPQHASILPSTAIL